MIRYIQQYIQVGTEYFRIINDGKSKRFSPISKEWAKEEGINLTRLPYYDGFTSVPCHNREYKAVIVKDGKELINLYNGFSHTPKEDYNLAEITYSISLIYHVFGEQWELGLDYIKLMYENPEIKLPALLLTGEPMSGKTTFINWMKAIFQSNSLHISGDEDDVQWLIGSESVICADDVFSEIYKHQILERMNSDKIRINRKGWKVFHIDSYAKFILATNSPKTLKLAEGDNIWVRELKRTEWLSPTLHEGIKKEVPAFLKLLNSGNLKTEKREGKFWFSYETLETPARKKLIEATENQKA